MSLAESIFSEGLDMSDGHFTEAILKLNTMTIALIVVFPCIFDKYRIILPTNAPFIKT